MSLMVSYFVLSFFRNDVLNETWDWIESVSDNFPILMYYIEFLSVILINYHAYRLNWADFDRAVHDTFRLWKEVHFCSLFQYTEILFDNCASIDVSTRAADTV